MAPTRAPKCFGLAAIVISASDDAFTPTCLAFEITRATHNYVEVTYELDAKRLDDVQRMVHIIFGLQS